MAGKAFATRYRANRLVYFETTNDALAALTREKQIKAWSRRKKVALVESMNPTWRDLGAA
jgi:putative endonuclease